MNDKEFNRSVLAELYKIADKVFEEGVNVPEEGSYTASELVRISKKKSIFKNGYITTKHITKSYLCGYETVYKDHTSEIAPLLSVKVGNFEASFCASKIFELVARFEKLAGFGKAKQRVYTRINKLDEIGSVTVLLDKSMAEMADFCDKRKSCANEKYKVVALDFLNQKIIATEGHILNLRKLSVIEATGEIPDGIYPLVEYKIFSRICKNAGKNGKPVKCTLIKEDGTNFWVCGGSKIKAAKWYNYINLFDGGIIKEKIVSLDNNEWKSVAKWIKQNDKVEDTGCVFIQHQVGSVFIRFIIQNKEFDINIDYTARCASVPHEAFVLCFQRGNLLTACKTFSLDISHKWKWGFNLNNDCVSIIMPCCFPSNCELVCDWQITGEKVNVFEYCGFNNNAQEVLNEAKGTTTVDECSVNENETPCNPVSAPQNELSERKEGNTETARLAKGNSKRFTLYSIGLQDGDELQFINGQTVTVCSEKKVAYEGREYTLSGFTKAFILKQNKSGTYRGIMYFYKDGVRLDKYAEAYFASCESGKGADPVLPKDETASTCATTPTKTPLINEASVETPCNEGIATSNTVGRVGFCMPVGRYPELRLIVVVVLLNMFSVPSTERNRLPVRRLPENLRVWGGYGSRTHAVCFTRIIPYKRRTTPVHALCNPPPYVWPARFFSRAIRRLCELFKTPNNKFIDMETSNENVQLSYYVMAATLAKRNNGNVALATIEEAYGEEAADKMFSFMQWPESKEWFGKSTCETGTMYYLNDNWAYCSLAAIRADMKRKMVK